MKISYLLSTLLLSTGSNAQKPEAIKTGSTCDGVLSNIDNNVVVYLTYGLIRARFPAHNKAEDDAKYNMKHYGKANEDDLKQPKSLRDMAVILAACHELFPFTDAMIKELFTPVPLFSSKDLYEQGLEALKVFQIPEADLTTEQTALREQYRNLTPDIAIKGMTVMKNVNTIVNGATHDDL